MTLTDHQPASVAHLTTRTTGIHRPTIHRLCRSARHCLPLLWLAAAFLGSTGTAYASTPAEKVVCTQAPRSQWMTEAQARQLFRADTYALVKFKVSKGNCHEFYAVDHQGTVVEAYLHPLTGETVRLTRLPAPSLDPSNLKGVRP